MKAARFVFNTFLIMLASIGVSLSFAAAEEVPVSHSDDLSYTTLYHDDYEATASVITDSYNYCPEASYTRWLGGSLNRSLRISYMDPYATSITGTGSSDAAFYLNNYIAMSGRTYTTCPDFSITLTNCEVTLDTSSLSVGYYRYIVDFWYGVAFSNPAPASNNISPTFTGISTYSDSDGTISFLGLEECQNYFAGNSYPFRSDLLHFNYETVFFFDGESSELTFDLTNYISNLGKTVLGYDLFNYTIGKLYYLNIWSNNRFYSQLYSNVEPPVSPTPSPTPYPGQDTQESINAGVDQIESQVSQLTNILDVHATPVPVPEELTIDETVIDVLETMTLPDLEDSRSTMSTMWQIFTPAVWFLALLASAIFVVSIFLWILRGGWL